MVNIESRLVNLLCFLIFISIILLSTTCFEKQEWSMESNSSRNIINMWSFFDIKQRGIDSEAVTTL